MVVNGLSLVAGGQQSAPVGGDLSSVAVPEDTFNKHINNLEVARVSCELEYPEDLGF